jgi:phage terminase large subunit GpA-like protein
MSMRANKGRAEEGASTYPTLGVLASSMTTALRPPERLSPSEAAEKYRFLQIPGAYHGPYLNETTPYMAEPLDVLADRSKKACIFVGPAQCGKPLASCTPVWTLKGLKTMGTLRVGDALLDDRFRVTQVTAAHPEMFFHDCFEVVFGEHGTLTASAAHLWVVRRSHDPVTTATLQVGDEVDRDGQGIEVTEIRGVPSVPVRCISVDSPSRQFLAGEGLIPTHNTDSLLLNAILYVIKCEPIDAIVYQTSQTVAADFSRTRLDRMHRHSPEIGKHVLSGGSADTVHAKYYDSGIVVNLSWPTINEMSGRPRGLVLLTDYDRMPQDVDGEGNPFDLGMKRTTTFRSRGKTICESSPGFEVKAGTTWLPRTKHEAPPCEGILSLYNRGDRRRWYWKCPSCREWFEPTFDLLRYPTGVSPTEAGAAAWMACPSAGCVITPDMRYEINKRGRWLRDGHQLTVEDVLIGDPISSAYASFWLFGVAAAFAPWSSLVEKYLMAEQEYERTGSQEALKATVNTDQGVPYRRRGQTSERNPEDLKTRADSWPAGTVPEGVRFLLATADVQGKKWVCQVQGISPEGIVVIDRFDISKSERLDSDGHPLHTEPHAFIEDWSLLEAKLIDRWYPIGNTGHEMRVKTLYCDSGGKEGVTARAYQYWTRLRNQGEGLHRRFQLVKGDHTPGAPRARVSYVDAQVKGQSADIRGEVPVLMLASNTLKDDLNGRLDRPGAIRIPEHLPDAVFTELCVEQRTEKGWTAARGQRQEAWDLLYYTVGACVHLGVEGWDWANAPSWARHYLDGNSLVREPAKEAPVEKGSNSFTGAGSFGKMLAS